MRSLLTLSALALLGLFVVPNMAHAALQFCDPAAPTNGAFCVNELCSVTVGTTTMDKDGMNLIACLKDGYTYDGSTMVEKHVWKSMTSATVTPSGNGGASYTAWGTTDCANGWSVAYTGAGLVAHQYVATATDVASTFGSVFCSKNSTLTDWNMFDAVGGRWYGNVGVNSVCAVCVK